MEIISLDQLIGSILNNGKRYVSHECKNLLSSGENYGSIMLDVKIRLEKDGQEEIVCCVAKTTPASEIMWRMFNTSVTFKKEISFYQEIVPTLNEFGKEKGIENLLPFFAKCVGARVSLDSTSTEVDKNAVLLLENLKQKGFTTADRLTGFNMEETKLILENLAVLHASGLAFRLQQPEVFKNKVRPHLNRDFIFCPEENTMNMAMAVLKSKISENPEVACLFPKVVEKMKQSFKLIEEPLNPNELYATIVHNDYWVNNTMLRYENGKAVENIMVDFQICEYNSPATDLVFFLYSSVQLDVLENNVDYFVRYYYDNFISTLEKLSCTTDRFTYESFLQDMNVTAKKFQVNHVVAMMQPIYTKRENATDLTKVEKENEILGSAESMHENYTKKLHFVLLDFEKRGWLDI